MEQIDFIENIKIFKLEPDDIIVLKTDQTLSMKMIKKLKERTEKVITVKVLILDNGLDIEILRKA